MESVRWKSTCFLYKGIDVYISNVKTIEMHAWWHAAHINPRMTKQFAVIMALLMGSQPVGMQCDIGRNMCSLCEEQVTPNSYHVIFVCKSLKEIQNSSLEQILHCMPTGMQIEFIRMHKEEKLRFLLSAFYIKFTIEWFNLYEVVALEVTKIYKERAALIALKIAASNHN